MKEKILEKLSLGIGSILAIVLIYLTFSFLYWDLNPMNWVWSGVVLFVVASGYSTYTNFTE